MKLVLNIVIFSLLLTYIFGYQVTQNSFLLDNRFALASLMFGASDNTDQSLTIPLTSQNSFLSFVSVAVQAYYNIPTTSSGIFMHYISLERDRTVPIPPQLRLSYHLGLFNPPYTGRLVTQTFNLSNENPSGPLSNITILGELRESCLPRQVADISFLPCQNSSLGDFFDHFVSADLLFNLRGLRMNPGASLATIIKWEISFHCSQTAHNSIILCDTTIYPLETQEAVSFALNLCLALVPLCLWDIVLRLRFFHRYRVYVSTYLPNWIAPNIRKNSRQFVRDWENHRHQEAGRGWTIYGIATDTTVLVFVTLSFIDEGTKFTSQRLHVWKVLMLGLSAFLSSILLCSFLQASPKFFVLMKTLAAALPHLVRYAIGVSPTFFGFAVCGTAAFGGFTSYFSSLPNSLTTLFCILNGDSLLQTFAELDQTNFYFLRMFSRVYLCSFLMFFIGNVLNIAVSIVQDAYNHVREVLKICHNDVAECEQRLQGHTSAPHTTSSAKPLTQDELHHILDRIEGIADNLSESDQEN